MPALSFLITLLRLHGTSTESVFDFQRKEFLGLKPGFDMGRQIIRSLRATIKCVGNLRKEMEKLDCCENDSNCELKK